MAPLFLLTPASLMWSAPFGCYASVLGLRCAFTRKALLDQYHNEQPTKDGSAPPGKKELDERLDVNVRTHVTFSEHVPIAMILIGLAEMNGAPLAAVHGLYGALFGLRVAHAEFGLRRPGRIGSGRAVGTLGTYAVIVAAGLINLSLSWDYLLSSLNLK